jgi:hypothetical protein
MRIESQMELCVGVEIQRFRLHSDKTSSTVGAPPGMKMGLHRVPQ